MAKVLLIIHDELLANAYRARLLREGFQVERCANGHDGLAKARQWIPDLIVLDLILPGLSGLDVLKLLRDVPWLATVNVVLLIDQTLQREILDECLLWGASSYVMKDRCSVGELVDHLKMVLTAPPVPHQP